MPRYGDYRDFQPGGESYDPEQFRADELERGRQSGTNATHGGSLQEVQSALDEMSKDPMVMAYVKQGKTEKVESLMAERYGLALPRHHALDMEEDGRLVPREQGKWERWKTPILLTAAMFGGGFALEAALAAGAAGGGAAGLGGGVGLGETGATTGLAGSGFGTGAGLGFEAVGGGLGAAGAAGGAGGAGGTLASTTLPQGLSTLPAGGSSVLGSSALEGAGGVLASTEAGQGMSTLPSGTSSVLGGTGGASGVGKYLTADNIGKVGSILGNAAANQAAGERSDNLADIARDRTALDRYEAGLKAPGTRLATSTNASRVKNFTPVTAAWGGPGSGLKGQTVKYSGGAANPNLVDARAKQLGDEILHQQLQEQLAGGGPPPLSKPRGGGIGNDLLGGAATAASLYPLIFGKR